MQYIWGALVCLYFLRERRQYVAFGEEQGCKVFASGCMAVEAWSCWFEHFPTSLFSISQKSYSCTSICIFPMVMDLEMCWSVDSLGLQLWGFQREEQVFSFLINTQSFSPTHPCPPKKKKIYIFLSLYTCIS